MKLQKLAIASSALVLLLAACKKNDSKPNCKIVSAVLNPGGISYQLSYDSDGKLFRVVSGKNANSYTYVKDTVIVKNLDSTGTAVFITTVVKNAQGLALSVKQVNTADNSWNNTEYTYNGTEVSHSISTSSGNSTPVETVYSWSNGNLASVASPGSVTEQYDYFTDKPLQNGDYLSFVQLIQGAEIIRNKNLLKTINGINLSYNFSPDGTIKTLQVVSTNTTSFLDYTYLCN